MCRCASPGTTSCSPRAMTTPSKPCSTNSNSAPSPNACVGRRSPAAAGDPPRPVRGTAEPHPADTAHPVRNLPHHPRRRSHLSPRRHPGAPTTTLRRTRPARHPSASTSKPPALDRFAARVVRHRLLAGKPMKRWYLPYLRISQFQISKALFSSPAEKIGHNLKFDLSILHAPRHRGGRPVFRHHARRHPGRPPSAATRWTISRKSCSATRRSSSPTWRRLPAASRRRHRRPVRFRRTNQSLQGTRHRRHPPGKTRRIRRRGRRCHLPTRGETPPAVDESGQEKILHEIEGPLLPVLVRMEMEGIAIDPPALGTIGDELQQPDRRTRRNPSSTTPAARSTSPRPNNSAKSSSTTSVSPTRRRKPRPANTRPTSKRSPRSKANIPIIARHPGMARGHQTQVHLSRRAAQPHRCRNRPHPHPFPPTRRRHRPPRLVRSQPPEHPRPIGGRPQDPQGLRPARIANSSLASSAATTRRSSCA